MTDESLLQFITRRMYEIEASGASEYLTGQIVAYDEIKRKVLETITEIESIYAANESVLNSINPETAPIIKKLEHASSCGALYFGNQVRKLIGESK